MLWYDEPWAVWPLAAGSWVMTLCFSIRARLRGILLKSSAHAMERQARQARQDPISRQDPPETRGGWAQQTNQARAVVLGVLPSWC